jgi:hypothetical protein
MYVLYCIINCIWIHYKNVFILKKILIFYDFNILIKKTWKDIFALKKYYIIFLVFLNNFNTLILNFIKNYFNIFLNKKKHFYKVSFSTLLEKHMWCDVYKGKPLTRVPHSFGFISLNKNKIK